MKVLFIVPDLAVGGVTTIVKSLSFELKNRGNEVKILSLKPTESEEAASLNILGKTGIFSGLIKLNRIVKEFKPDIIHTHTVFPHILVNLYKLIYKVRIGIVNTEHNTLSTNESKKVPFLIYKHLSSVADKVTFVSQASRNSYVKLGVVLSKKTCVIYNGIDTKKIDTNIEESIREEINSSNSKIKFCFIGRFSKEKNIKLLIDSFELFNNKYSEFQSELFLIGFGDLEGELLELVKEKNLNNVIFLGYKSNVYNYIEKMDCIVLSSLTESLPTIILESYAQKKIVISTDCGGVSEIIEDSRFLSKIDCTTSFVQCLYNFCIIDKREGDYIKDKNYKRYQELFSTSNMIDLYGNLYLEVGSDK